jgi:hypothetical protein
MEVIVNKLYLKTKLISEIQAFSKKLFPEFESTSQGLFEDALATSIDDYVTQRLTPIEAQLTLIESRISILLSINQSKK